MPLIRDQKLEAMSGFSSGKMRILQVKVQRICELIAKMKKMLDFDISSKNINKKSFKISQKISFIIIESKSSPSDCKNARKKPRLQRRITKRL